MMNLNLINQRIDYLDGLLKTPLYQDNKETSQTLSQYLFQWCKIMEAHQVSEVFESKIKDQTGHQHLISPSTISTDPEIREQLLREIKHSHKLEGNTTRLSDYQTFESDYDRLTSNFGYPSIEKTVAGYLVQWLQQNGESGVEHWINVPYLGWDGLQITPDDILRQSTDNSNPRPLDGDHFLYKASRLYQISEDYKQLRRRSKKHRLTKVQLDKIQNWIRTLRALFTYSDLSPLEKHVRQPDHGGFNDNSIRTQPQLSTSSMHFFRSRSTSIILSFLTSLTASRIGVFLLSIDTARGMCCQKNPRVEKLRERSYASRYGTRASFRVIARNARQTTGATCSSRNDASRFLASERVQKPWSICSTSISTDASSATVQPSSIQTRVFFVFGK